MKAFTCRRVKNDQRDAADLADLLRMGRLPEAWIAPPAVRELRELTRYRASWWACGPAAKDQVHAVLAKLGVPATCTAGSAWLDGLALPQPYAGKVTSLRQLTGELSTEITMLSDVIADLLAGDRGYPVIQQLPGTGPVLAAVVSAEAGEVTRFRTAGQLCSWAGLTPRHRESGTGVTRGHVTKQGSPILRWALTRGDPAPARRVTAAGSQGCHHRPPRQPSPQHRQGRRRPPAAHAGVLRPARRADPCPVPSAGPPGGAGRMTTLPWPAASGQRPAASGQPPGRRVVCPPPGGASANLIDPADRLL
ncbi:MAG: transposase [Micromonosporaceae bacterium]